jgi:putative salt-induced outer membrane protein YdiY
MAALDRLAMASDPLAERHLTFQLDRALSTKLFDDFEIKVSYYHRYDSQPPTDVGHVDYGLALSLSYAS